MNNFGWDYPAGCTSVPGDEPELPEACPMCGAANADEQGEPVYTDPAFCGEACASGYYKAQAEAEARYSALCDEVPE